MKRPTYEQVPWSLLGAHQTAYHHHPIENQRNNTKRSHIFYCVNKSIMEYVVVDLSPKVYPWWHLHHRSSILVSLEQRPSAHFDFHDRPVCARYDKTIISKCRSHDAGRCGQRSCVESHSFGTCVRTAPIVGRWAIREYCHLWARDAARVSLTGSC